MENHQEALAKHNENKQSDNVQTARLLHNMALTMAKQGKYWKANEKFKQSFLAIRRKQLGKNHSSTVRTPELIAEVQNDLIFIGNG